MMKIPRTKTGRNAYAVACLLPLLLALVLCPPGRGQTRTPGRQAPALPVIVFENFGPGIREQVKRAYDEARRSPRDAAMLGRLGMTLHAYDEFENAAACYALARRSAPGEFQWAYLLGVAQAATGRTAEATTMLREALRLRPEDMPARLRLADLLFHAGELVESRQLYEAVIAKRPDLAAAHYGLGRVKAALRDPAAAAEHLRRACELSPEYGAAHYALAMAYRDLGQREQSTAELALYQQFRLVRPATPDPLLQSVAGLNVGAAERLRVGVALEAAGRLSEAIAEHEKALAINPLLEQAHLNLITLHARAGRFEKAEQQYRTLQTLNPNLAESHYNYGVMLLERKRFDEAGRAFRRCLEINPGYSEAALNLGRLLEMGARYDEALGQYEAAVESNPGRREAHFQLARMLLYKNRGPEAIEHLKRTLTPEDAETPRYLYALGAAYARSGDRPNAVRTLHAARDLAAAWKQTDLLARIEQDLKTLESPQ
ncbi:MAG: tetratricopeptide repeat protein [Blastocatellia bacterium]|nr:tetratricopeptide repeat protein [Blastocatellia bacterium]